MLGWFKKKFSKKEETASAPVAESKEPEKIDAGEQIEEIFVEEMQVSTPTTAPDEQPSRSDESRAHPATEKVEKNKVPSQKTSMFKRLSDSLAKTRGSFVYQMDSLFLGKKEIDSDLLDELEEILITADLGVGTTMDLLEDARRRVQRKELSDPAMLKELLKEKLRSFIVLDDQSAEMVMPDSGPFVIMVVGVNGVGKTTTIGKITHKFKQSGQSVLLVAADTFRAAAVAQLKIWGERNEVEVVSGQEEADPSSVAFDAMDIAGRKDYDVVIVDTAGRLHTQVNLMEELKKIKRVMGKRLEGAPHEILLVLDATTGQNALSQAKLFNEAVTVTGLVMTKLDGTAKGGIIANITRELKIPFRFIGIGEQMEDLRDFDPDEFTAALFQDSNYQVENN